MAVEITAENFDAEVAKYPGVVLIDFWATWCGPCKMIAPVIEELTKDYSGRAKICKVNVDDNAQLSARFSISSIPTLLLLKNGKVMIQTVGIISKAEIQKRIDSLL